MQGRPLNSINQKNVTCVNSYYPGKSDIPFINVLQVHYAVHGFLREALLKLVACYLQDLVNELFLEIKINVQLKSDSYQQKTQTFNFNTNSNPRTIKLNDVNGGNQKQNNWNKN